MVCTQKHLCAPHACAGAAQQGDAMVTWTGNMNTAVQGQDFSTSFRQSFRGLRLLQCTMW